MQSMHEAERRTVPEESAPARAIPFDIALAVTAWLAATLVALVLPLLFFTVAERYCPPAEFDPGACLSEVRSVLFWISLLGASATGAALCVLLPAFVVRRLDAAWVARGSFLAGAGVLGLLYVTLRHPYVLPAALAALAAGGACVLATRGR
jgi:hypothetical protein